MKKYELSEMPAAALLIIASAISVLKTRTGLLEKLNSLSGGFAELMFDTITDMALGGHEGFSSAEVAAFQYLGGNVGEELLNQAGPDLQFDGNVIPTTFYALADKGIKEDIKSSLTDQEYGHLVSMMTQIGDFMEKHETGILQKLAGAKHSDPEIVVTSRTIPVQEVPREAVQAARSTPIKQMFDFDGKVKILLEAVGQR